MKQMNRSLAIAWLCIVCAMTPIPKAQSQTTIFSDNFSGNSIDATKWTFYGNTVLQTNQTMEVLTTVTDGGGALTSVPIPINATGKITITREVLVHYGNDYFDGQFGIQVGSLPWFSIWYASIIYSDGVNYMPRYGFFLARNNGRPDVMSSQANVSSAITPLWDTWFAEKTTYDPTSGIMEYFINNVSQLTYNVGVMPPTNSPTMTLVFTTWGWYTGHEQLFSNFFVTQDIKQPVIVMQPTNQSVQANSTTTFNVIAYGQQPLNYKWQFNGQSIPNATNATLTLNSVTAANDGGYSVVVWDAYGSVISATASLAVLTESAYENQVWAILLVVVVLVLVLGFFKAFRKRVSPKD